MTNFAISSAAFGRPVEVGSFHFTLLDGPRVEVPLSGDRDEDVRRVTQACTKVLEAQIRQHPEYWLWMHRRWKHAEAVAQLATTASEN
mgnify:CR=1 FL=1